MTNEESLKDRIFSLKEIERRLTAGGFPFRGRTKLDSAVFEFERPAFSAAVTLHASFRVREQLRPVFQLSAEERRREEDPFTDRFLAGFPFRITARDSRYEYDLNRNPQRAVYHTAWGKKVWKRALTPKEKEPSLKKHAEFHRLMEIVAASLIREEGFGIVFDLHSFNYRREEDPEEIGRKKPDINIGTAASDRKAFGRIIEDLLQHLDGISVGGRKLRISENEIFKGGYLTRNLAARFPGRILVVAVEFKKIFMDERTGRLNKDLLEELAEQFSRAARAAVDNSPSLYRK